MAQGPRWAGQKPHTDGTPSTYATDLNSQADDSHACARCGLNIGPDDKYCSTCNIIEAVKVALIRLGNYASDMHAPAQEIRYVKNVLQDAVTDLDSISNEHAN